MPFDPGDLAVDDYQWKNAPSRDTPLDEAHLEAAQELILSGVRQVAKDLGDYADAHDASTEAAAEAAAEAVAAAALAAHNAATDVHGIADTSKLAAVTATKRVTQPISGDGGTALTANNAAYPWTSGVLRWLVELPVTPTRWRLRIRNYSIVNAAAETGQVSIAGVAIGAPKFGAASGVATQWDGQLAGAPATALGAFAAAADGSDYTTPWVTDAGAYFKAGVETAVSIGYDVPTGTSIPYSSYGCISRFGAGQSANFAALSIGDYTTLGGGASIFDVRLEYEYVTTQAAGADADGHVPVVLAIGDSITRGIIDNGPTIFGLGLWENGGIYQHQNWAGSAGLRNKVAVVNLGVGGSTAVQWAASPTTDWRWQRADLATTVPEAAIIMLGSNDCSALTALATTKANVQTIVNYCRTVGIKRVYLATVIPRNFAWPTTYEIDNVAVTGAPAGGTIALAFELLGQAYGATSIAYNATAAQVAAAVQAVLPMSNAVVGTGGPLGTSPVTLTFQGAAYGPVTGQAVLNQLTGGTSPAATFTQSQAGGITAETLRVSLNNWIRQQPDGVDGVFDFDKALRLESSPQVADLDYTTVSQIHPSAGGHQKMASLISLR